MDDDQNYNEDDRNGQESTRLEHAQVNNCPDTDRQVTGDTLFACQPPGSHLQRDGDELVLVGDETAAELSSSDVVALSYQMRDRTVTGLFALLAEATVLGVLAMTGVAAGWFETASAIEILAITLTPSFTAWLVLARWAFPQRGAEN